VWYLENVFFQAAGRIVSFLQNKYPEVDYENNPIIKMGFWPGGDRDGNPFVDTETTLNVADALRGAIIKCYYIEIRKLRRRLTFKGVDVLLLDLEKQLYNNIFIPGNRTDITKKDILKILNKVREILIYQHNGLFCHLIDGFINKVHIFGLYFASLDIRQDSSIHKKVFTAMADSKTFFPSDYDKLSDEKKIEFLTKNSKELPEKDYGDPIINDTFKSIKAIKLIQQYNGERGCNRYIISHAEAPLHVLQIYGLFILCGWKKEKLKVDIVPLIETIGDLQNSVPIMKALFENKEYREHLKRRNNVQTIMLGFSDGTKDGGYLMGNWCIYRAKEELTAISKEFEIDVVFFDGRGGPPARGGGKTHKFYASMGKNISNKEIQLTIQGQTVSSNFGTIDSAQYNLEQLLNAGISNDIFADRHTKLEKEEEDLLQNLAEVSFQSYSALKNHPDFMDYLVQVSPLKFYSDTNIGSRPTKRKKGKMNLDDLRAIPFVGSWSQIKQNVTGYYGVGTSLQKMEQEGKFGEFKKLYQDSLFFRTLIDNCEMAMKKCYFPLTEYLSRDSKFSEIWNMIYDEYEITKKYLFKLTGNNQLMADYPVEQLSVDMREKMILPLVTIQQYAMTKIREMEQEQIKDPLKQTYEKLIMRCSFGIINAGRNSA
jgi:phosphoenolpyruvate carboxylase